MSEKDLRNFIIEEQRESCQGEPGAHAIANFLSAFQWFIYEADGTQYRGTALKVFEYDQINSLRTDATALLASLKSELGEEEWMRYFEARNNLLNSSK